MRFAISYVSVLLLTVSAKTVTFGSPGALSAPAFLDSVVRNRRFYRSRALLFMTVSYEIVTFGAPRTVAADSLVRIVRFRFPDALPETLQSVPGLAEPRNRLHARCL